MAGTSELQKRIFTGIIGAAALLSLVVFGGRPGVALLVALLSLAMVYEFVEMTFRLPDKREKRFVLLGVSWLINFCYFWIPGFEYGAMIWVFLGLFAYFLFSAERHQDAALRAHFEELVLASFGIIYLAFLPLFLVAVRDWQFGLHWTILFLLIVWLGDTGAYFSGKRFGKRRLYPAISPKKTIEGSIGGLVCGLIIVIGYKLVLFPAMPWLAAIVMPIVVGAVSQVGDLCESFLKRAYDTKDSGTLLPGHGGFLDRFDSVVFSAPVMYGCMRLLAG